MPEDQGHRLRSIGIQLYKRTLEKVAGLTLKELKRIPMDKPVGKSKLYNKINRSEGTSH